MSILDRNKNKKFIKLNDYLKYKQKIQNNYKGS